MSKTFKVAAAKVPTSWGRSNHKLVNNRMQEGTTASDEKQKEKTAEQDDVLESDVCGQNVLDRMVSEGISDVRDL